MLLQIAKWLHSSLWLSNIPLWYLYIWSQSVSCSVMSNSLRPHGLQPARIPCPRNSPGKNTGVDIPFFRGSFQPRNQTQVSCISGRFFIIWGTREAHLSLYHIFFIHSSVDGHLACLHVLDTVNSTAINTGLDAAFQVSVFIYIYVCMYIYIHTYMYIYIYILDHMVALWTNLYCFPQWLHQFTFPPTVYKGSLFSTSSLTSIICRFFDDSHTNRCEVTSHCCFDLHVSRRRSLVGCCPWGCRELDMTEAT